MKVDREFLILYAITDRTWLNGKALKDEVKAAIEGGATMIQLREKNLSYEEFFEEEALPARVELLFTAFNSFRVGEISKKDLLSEFSKYRNLIKQVRREFSVKSNELFNGEYAEEAHAMDSGLRTMDSTLEKIIEMLETGRDITDVMSDLRMAGYYLEDIRARIS